jgi:hypothetical protein
MIPEHCLQLTIGEIWKSKLSLNSALAISGSSNNNHMRALILALLSNLFLHIRKEESFKMIQSAYFLARGLGGDNKSLDGTDRCVGQPWLGEWLGERKLEILKEESDAEKIEEQIRLNEAHSRVIKSIQNIRL